MTIYDAHAHLGNQTELEIRNQKNITTFLCAGNPKDAEEVREASSQSSILIPTYGLHPWYADQYEVDEMLPYLKECRLIGEIGMDSVWCNVPLERQKEVFLQQLDLAHEYNMPVILHTKGQEKEILDCIKPYKFPILVHWYSCKKYLEQYLEKDCFFTIGPDVHKNPTVKRIIYKTEVDRLLVETDGLEACKWALGDNFEEGDIYNMLMKSVRCIANIKNMRLLEVISQLEQNFMYLRDYRR